MLCGEAEIAGSEVELLVVERVVGDVHFAVDRGDVVGVGGGVVRAPSLPIEDGGGVVVEAGGAALEERGDDDELVLADDRGEGGCGRAGNGFGDGKQGVVFALAEVLGAEEFGEADEGGASLGGFADAGDGLGEVGLGVGGAGHLDEGDAGGFGRHEVLESDSSEVTLFSKRQQTFVCCDQFEALNARCSGNEAIGWVTVEGGR